MKKFIPFAIILIMILASCKKDEDPPEPTSYRIYNGSSFGLYFYSYYWSNNQMYDLVDHGYLNPNGYSGYTKTERDYITVRFKKGNVTYVVASPYHLTEHTTNTMTVTDNTLVQIVK